MDYEMKVKYEEDTFLCSMFQIWRFNSCQNFQVVD